MAIAALLEKARKNTHKCGNGYHLVSPMAGLSLLKCSELTHFEASIYHPVICLILQGAKETTIGERVVSFSAGQSLIVSHTVPVVSRVTQASVKKPYLALVLDIDLTILRSLYSELDDIPVDEKHSSALNVEKTDDALVNALEKYLDLSENALELKILGPLLLKEIHFRMLMAPHGNTLRKLLGHESYASQISKVLVLLRENYKQPLSVSALAKTIGMSESSFYTHFKNVTETSPLQYQKDLRLIEAQRVLRSRKAPVSSVAFEVGYESPTQFSREYSRKFGFPPSEEKNLLATQT